PSATGDDATPSTATPSTAVPSTAATTTVDPRPLTIVFGGDVHLDGPLATTLAQNPAALFDGLQPALSEADLAVINLETAVTTRGQAANKQFTFRAAPAIFTVLREAGVDVIAGANNHSIDYGPQGFTDTLSHAAEARAPLIGLGMDAATAYAPYSTTIRGRRVAVLNATDVLDGPFVTSWTATDSKAGVASAKNTERLLAEVRAARSGHDTVIVFLHWGVEATTCPSTRQEDLAIALRDAGADVVVGSHAHRVLSSGYLDGAYVHYGLGNLVFKTSSVEGRRTGLLRLTLEGRSVVGSEWLPARIGADYTPALLDGADADAERRVWNERRACTELTEAPVA
ncbi:MAG: CapA family protein, partial [Actinobacteria bacterium]|nr:CapA family protein [Actinomycetota bacterium]